MQQADRTHTSTGASTSLTNGELGNGHQKPFAPQPQITPAQRQRAAVVEAPPRAVEASATREQAVRPGHQDRDRSERWTVAVGALFALIAMREGFRWIKQQPAVTQIKHTSMVDAFGAVFVLSEGLRRVGAWALRAPTGNARS